MVNKYLTFEDIVDSPFVEVKLVIENEPNPDGSIPIETKGLGIITQEVADVLQKDIDIQAKIDRVNPPVKKQLP